MPSAGFETAIPATKRPPTETLDRVATGIDVNIFYWTVIQFIVTLSLLISLKVQDL
jgi:hypothetical protein